MAPTPDRPRLQDIALSAGVSEATVSRVVNRRAGVAPATRRKVLQALRATGYAPRGPERDQRSPLVGMIVPELDNPVFPAFAQAIESRLAGRNLTTVLGTSTPAGMSEAQYVDVLLDHGVSGIVVVSGAAADVNGDHGHYTVLREAGVPVVAVNGRAPGLNVPVVNADIRGAGRRTVRHLVDLGHRRIGLAVGPLRYVPSRQCLEGFGAGLRDAGIAPEDDLVAVTVFGVEGGHSAAVQLIAQEVTAIVCASDLMAIGAIRAARDDALSVPDDLSVVGYDDAGFGAWTAPPLTSMRQPIGAMSDAVVALLTDAMSRRRVDVDDLRFPTELIVRASTGPVRA
jgi:LacI family transcriptional regulator, repressor for deo operon, udp, cdd, tsx, nupC, and nupG